MDAPSPTGVAHPRRVRTGRPSVTLDQLHTFVAVADAEHLRRAAESIHLSQAAVSQQLRLLERSLGLPLFERLGRSLRLNADGRALREAAAAALDAVRTLEDIAVGRRGIEQGQLTLYAGNIIGQHRVPALLATFLERFPGVDVELELGNTAQALAALAAGVADVAIIGSDPPGTDFESVLLERDELLVVVASHHPLASAKSPARELDKHRYLARGPGSGTERVAQRMLGQQYGRGAIIELGQGAVQYALLAGLGYAVMPRIAVAEHLETGRLVILARPGRKPVTQDFFALRRRGPHPPVVDAFWGQL